MPKNSDSQPWERRDGEGIKAYEAFSLYLQMGSDRSLRKVAQQLGKSKTLIDRWSSTHSWVERVGAYEEHLQEEAYKTARKKSRKMADRHISMALQMQELALKKLKEYGTEEGLKEIDPKTLIALIREATKLERDNREDVERRENPKKDETAEASNSLADVITSAWERRKADGKL